MIWFMAPVLFALFWKDHPAFFFFLMFVLIVFSGGRGSKPTSEHLSEQNEITNKE